MKETNTHKPLETMKTTKIYKAHDRTIAQTWKNEDVTLRVEMSDEMFDYLWEKTDWKRSEHADGDRWLDIPKKWFEKRRYEWVRMNEASETYIVKIVKQGKSIQDIVKEIEQTEQRKPSQNSADFANQVVDDYWG